LQQVAKKGKATDILKSLPLSLTAACRFSWYPYAGCRGSLRSPSSPDAGQVQFWGNNWKNAPSPISASRALRRGRATEGGMPLLN